MLTDLKLVKVRHKIFVYKRVADLYSYIDITCKKISSVIPRCQVILIVYTLVERSKYIRYQINKTITFKN